MARRVTEREDLLRDATGLVPRIQLHCHWNGQPVEIFAGFRRGGALSLYFDTEPVFHFNSQRELRRAYLDGSIVKAERRKLVRWRPDRSPDNVAMIRQELDSLEVEKIASDLMGRTRELARLLAAGDIQVVGEVPPGGEALPRLRAWLAEFHGMEIADSPRVG